MTGFDATSTVFEEATATNAHSPAKPTEREARPPLAALWIVFAVLALASASPRPAAAHAFLETSIPAANAVLPDAPQQVTLGFTEPLEQSYSRAELYDASGDALPGASTSFGEDGYSMILALPPGLANGTYAVLWRTLSTADGHTAQGYVPFTVGSDRDVSVVVAPAPSGASTGAPEIVKSASRWFALMGLAAAVAIWPIWVFVLRPAISPAWQAGPAMARRARRFAAWAIVAAFVADLVALGVQALATVAAGGFFGSVQTTLFATRYGTLWLVRVGLLLVYAAALLGVSWWWPRRRPATTFAAMALAALLPLPFSLLAHAAAQPAGRATAIAFDVVHLLAASVWVGGILALLAIVAPTLNDLTPMGRQVVLGRALPRFSFIALAAWGAMLLTGLYAAWLQVGNLTALTTTDYGRTLMIKLALLVPLLALAAFNLLVVSRKIERATDEEASSGWSGNFVTALAAEALLVTLLLGVVGMLIGQAPGREEIAQFDGRMVIPLSANGQEGRLIVTPGSVGPNHYRLELGSGHEAHLRSPSGSEAVLRFELPSERTGQTELQLAPAAAGAFEGHGSQLAIAGEWTIEAKVTGAGQPDWDVRVTQPVGLESPASDQPPPPPRFGPAGIAGLLLLLTGVVGAAWAVMAKQSVMRKEAAGLGVAGVLLGLVVLFGARLPGTLAAPAAVVPTERPDQALVERGAPLFATNCATCHGATGRGDGPLAGTDGIVPSDLTAPHAYIHDDATMAFWIRNGIAGTKMPGFPDLNDDEIASIVAYVRGIQFDAMVARAATEEETCTVEPRTLASLRVPDGTPEPGVVAMPTPDGTPPGEGEPATEEQVAIVRDVARELVACTNAGDTMRRLALYSQARVERAYPNGPTDALERIAGTPFPVLPEERVALLDVADVRQLRDGRLVARVTIDNPQFLTHGTATPTANPTRAAALLVFVEEGGRWRIDEIHQ